MKPNRNDVLLDAYSPMRIGLNRQYQTKAFVELSEIESQIRAVEEGLDGQLELTRDGRRLTIRAEPGKYLLTISNNEDEIIARFFDKNKPAGVMVPMGGDLWGSRTLCNDVDQVVDIALVFAKTGRLTRSVDWDIDEDLANEEDLLTPQS